MDAVNPERFARIEELFHSTLEQDPAARDGYLAEACGADDELRGIVSSLLSQDLAESPFAGDAIVMAAGLLTDSLTPGTLLGPYRILGRLGEGGMGAVYNALDTRLNRHVAVKVTDQEFSSRFQREARAISALNHPNICTLYDVGPNYLVMELIDGQTLSGVLRGRRIPMPLVFSYAVQIADAVAAAHRAGIVHRDLKPGNIMVAAQGRVKVLDFGLAVMSDSAGSSQETVTRTLPGMIVGTPAYMSPEQARGQPADARSDIFSFGAVLYEMIAGRPAFQGDTAVETAAAVIRQDPPPVEQIVPDIPFALAKITGHCLEKDPALRFQHMGDVALLLHDAAEEAKRGAGAASQPVARRWPWLAAAGIILAMAGAGAAWRFGGSPPASYDTTLRRLTFDGGLTTTPAVSTDGNLLAFASDRAGQGNLDIWVRQLAGGEPVQVTHDSADEYEPSFSPEGTRIVFRSDRQGGGIYVTSALGNDEPRLLAPEGRSPKFSPDGTRIAYWVGEPHLLGSDRPMRAKLFVMSASGAERREVAPELAAAYSPIWSPDGKYILFAGSAIPHVLVSPDLFVVPAAGGRAQAAGATSVFKELNLANPIPSAWTDRGQILFSAVSADTANVWQVSLKPAIPKITGPVRRLTFGAEAECSASVVGGPGPVRLVLSVLKSNIDLWRLQVQANEVRPSGEPQRITQDEALSKWPALSRDGKLLFYSSNRSGAYAIYRRDLSQNKETMIAPGNVPALSADGKRLVYASTENSGYHLLETGPAGAGKAPMPLNVRPGSGVPYSLSDDGQLFFYAVKANERWGVEMLDLASGRTVTISHYARQEMFSAGASPDRRWLAFTVLVDGRERIIISPFPADGSIKQTDSFPLTDASTAFEGRPAWSPDGNSIFYTSDRDGFRCVWAQRVNPLTKRPTGPEIPVCHLHSARRSIRNLSSNRYKMVLASDKLVFNMGELTGNIWLAQLGAR